MAREPEYPSATDQALVRLAQRGDMQAFEELVARHRDKVYSRAYSMMRNDDDALDLSQEAWVKAWQRLVQFQGDSSFTTWITRIVINLCLDAMRRQKRLHAESIDQMAEDGGGVERHLPTVQVDMLEGLDREELRVRIDEGLRQLSDAHRTVLILHEYEGLEYKECAKRMGCSIGTIMSRLFYARRRLASLLIGMKEDRKP
jgi:RNA polymerase sigma-70 factor (ECF subfamily)